MSCFKQIANQKLDKNVPNTSPPPPKKKKKFIIILDLEIACVKQ